MSLLKLRNWPAKLLLGSIWLVAVGIGIKVMGAYERTEGAPSAAVKAWPREAVTPRVPDRSTLVLVLHPRCACSRATLAELARVMAHAQGRVSATVLFVRPTGAAPGWEKTDLWRSAEAIPGVTPIADVDGAEARRFHAETSGSTLLFAPSGELLFQGGITGSRGHAGDNAGETSVSALLSQGQTLTKETPVYGCALF